jgi:hypothetical protein
MLSVNFISMNIKSSYYWLIYLSVILLLSCERKNDIQPDLRIASIEETYKDEGTQ